MKHLPGAGRNHHFNGNLRAYSGFGLSTNGTDKDDTYYAAFKLVTRIDEDLDKGVRHYRDKTGRLLTTLDEVVLAILDNNLLMDEHQENETVWLTPQELAA